MKIVNYILLLVTFVMVGCEELPTENVNTLPSMQPNYVDITIPANIAPLNFAMNDSAQGVEVYVDGELLDNSGSNKMMFNVGKWKKMMASKKGETVSVVVEATYGDKKRRYNPFTWTIADSIDPYMTYRLIEPDYEVFQNLEIRERCVENFDERAINTYHVIGNRCMNCHTYANSDPNMSMMYVRGEGGGAILNEKGVLRKLNIEKTPDMVSSSVYFGFSPSQRYITFSTNVIVPAFHSNANKRMEVFDSKSDVYVADVNTGKIIPAPQLADSMMLETFPNFSRDGKYIYFCRAAVENSIEDLQYDLCRVSFDEDKGTIGDSIETVIKAVKGQKNSVSHPRVSPDGNYLLYTVADYGTFPIWHQESDLRMMDLRTGAIDNLQTVNSDRSDTYHCWSSNGRWFVFASKRDDGLYGKPYFCYVDTAGRVHKPFVLPQENPLYYDYTLKSFNVPELGKGKVPFDAQSVRKIVDN